MRRGTLVVASAVLLIAGCSASAQEAEVRTDVAPLEERLPVFAQASEVQWVSEATSDERVPGPNMYEVVGWARVNAGYAAQVASHADLTSVPLPEAVAESAGMDVPDCDAWAASDAWNAEANSAKGTGYWDVDFVGCEGTDLVAFVMWGGDN